ncbi:MAG: insulinase family protein, partial [Actinomycetota bacterium]|nr:insulinase family protein [Actinomycetota bacterium]
MYVGGNVVLAAAGNLEHERLLELMGRVDAHRGITDARPARPLLVAPPPPSVRFAAKDTEQYHVCLGAPAVSRSDPRRFAASLLDAILGGSASSRLFQEIREKRGMAYSVYSFASQYTDSGLVGIYVGTREENLATCFEIVAEQVAELAAGRLRDAELDRAKENLKGRTVLAMESTATRMSRLGKSIVTATELLSLDRLIAEIDAVEPEAVAELAAELLFPETLSAAGIGPSAERFAEAVARISPGLVARAAA